MIFFINHNRTQLCSLKVRFLSSHKKIISPVDLSAAFTLQFHCLRRWKLEFSSEAQMKYLDRFKTQNSNEQLNSESVRAVDSDLGIGLERY